MILFGMFAVTAFILVLIGIKQYKVTADSMNYNYEVRTASSYLREKIRQNDIGAGIHVENIDGTDVLALSSNINGQTYKTYIYYYDKSLRELFVSEDSVYSLESGQEIINIAGFSAAETPQGYIDAVIYDTSGICGKHRRIDLSACHGFDQLTLTTLRIFCLKGNDLYTGLVLTQCLQLGNTVRLIVLDTEYTLCIVK